MQMAGKEIERKEKMQKKLLVSCSTAERNRKRKRRGGKCRETRTDSGIFQARKKDEH